MADELDMENRDPNNLNGHLAASFEEVLGEPSGIHSIDCVWRNSYKCYNFGQHCCYKFITVLCGICAALAWGCCFACIAADHIWCITPCFKVWDINLACLRKYYKSLVDLCMGPCCEVCGLFFSQIKVTNG